MKLTAALLFSAVASASFLDRLVGGIYEERDNALTARGTTLVARDTTGSPSDPAVPISRDPLPDQPGVDTVLNALTVIEQLTINSTWTIGNFTGNITDALKIQKATTVLNDATYNATLACQQIANLSVSDTLALGSFTQGLAYAVNASIATLISKKPLFDKLGITSLTVTSLQGLAFGSYVFGNAVSAKVPPELMVVSLSLGSQTVQSIEEGLRCFNGTASSCITTIANPDRTLDTAIENGTLSAAPTVKATGWFTLVMAVIAIAMAI